MNDSKGDKGPFTEMDPDLERAITRYGTPPYREKVRVAVRDIGHCSFDSLPTTPEEWIGWLEEAVQDTPPEYRDQLNCILNWEPGCYDSGDSSSLEVWYERPETDQEMTERVNRGITYVRRLADHERATYEALKKKFDK